MTAVWRIDAGEGPRLAAGPPDGQPEVLLRAGVRVSDLLQPGGWWSLPQLAAGGEPVPAGHRVLAPVDEQDVWAAGVTYRRSRDARLRPSPGSSTRTTRCTSPTAPSSSGRPGAGEARGPGETVGIRADSTLGRPRARARRGGRRGRSDRRGGHRQRRLVARASRARTRCTCRRRRPTGTASALGPCARGLVRYLPDLMAGSVAMTIRRGGAAVVEGAVQLSEMQRGPADLVRWLQRSRDLPHARRAAHGHRDRARARLHAGRRRRGANHHHRARRARQHRRGGVGRRVPGRDGSRLRRQPPGDTGPGPSPAASTAGSCASSSPSSVASQRWPGRRGTTRARPAPARRALPPRGIRATRPA